MKQTIEQKLDFSVPEGAKNIRVEVTGKTNVSITYELEVELLKEVKNNSKKMDSKFTQEYLDKYFPIVKASELSLEDDFLQHEPKTVKQRKFKKRLIEAINSGLSDFRAPAMDPSIDKNGDICYEAGKNPAVGKSAEWWFEKAKRFMPEKNSRHGLTREHDAFLAVLIKFLIKEWGYSKDGAWKAVCDDSKNLGNYLNSANAKCRFELTGSRKVGKHCDLDNTFKITAEDLQGSKFSLVGGNSVNDSSNYPLADVNHVFDPYYYCNNSVGWLVLDV